MSLHQDDIWPTCSVCGDEFDPRRQQLGYDTCLRHGEAKKSYCAVPVPKSNYIIATSREQVVNPYSHKGTR
jgi:hypothetical protein